jgi:hypothetical protein
MEEDVSRRRNEEKSVLELRNGAGCSYQVRNGAKYSLELRNGGGCF